MPKYSMPDGNVYEFSSDAEATEAMEAWQKQFGKQNEISIPEVPQTKEYDVGDSLGAGFLSKALSMSRALGGADVETQKKAIQDKMASSQQNPIATGLGGMAVTMAAATPGMVAGVGSLGPLAGMGLQAITSGGPAALGETSERYQELLMNGATEDEAQAAAGITGATTMLGFGLPASLGGSLGNRVLGGAGLNVATGQADRIGGNLVLPDRLETPFSAGHLALDAALGGVVGAVGPKTNPFKTTPKQVETGSVNTAGTILEKQYQNLTRQLDSLNKKKAEFDTQIGEASFGNYTWTNQDSIDYTSLQHSIQRTEEKIKSVAKSLGKEDVPRTEPQPTTKGTPTTNIPDVDVSGKRNPFFQKGVDPRSIDVEIDSAGRPFRPDVTEDTSIVSSTGSGKPVMGQNQNGKLFINPDEMAKFWHNTATPEQKELFGSLRGLQLFAEIHEATHNTVKQLAGETRATYEQRMNGIILERWNQLRKERKISRKELNEFEQRHLDEKKQSPKGRELAPDEDLPLEAYASRQSPNDDPVRMEQTRVIDEPPPEDGAIGTRASPTEEVPLSAYIEEDFRSSLGGLKSTKQVKASMDYWQRRLDKINERIANAEGRRPTVRDPGGIAKSDHGTTNLKALYEERLKAERSLEYYQGLFESGRNTGVSYPDLGKGSGKQRVTTTEVVDKGEVFATPADEHYQTLRNEGKNHQQAQEEVDRLYPKDMTLPFQKTSDTLNKNTPDAPSKTPFKVAVPIENTNTVVSQLQKFGKDLGASAKIISNWFGNQQLKGIFQENPVIRQMANIVRKADVEVTAIRERLLYGEDSAKRFEDYKNASKGFIVKLSRIENGDAAKVIIEKATNDDFFKVFKVFEQGYGAEYGQTFSKYGSTLNEDQKKLFLTLSKLFDRQWNEIVRLQESMGKKNTLPMAKGWYPAVRKGDFFVELRLDGEVAYRQHFRSKLEADHWMKLWNRMDDKKGLVASTIQKKQDVKEWSIVEDMGQHIAKELEKQFGDVTGKNGQLAREVVETMMDRFVIRGGKLGKHHEFRTNIPGALGTELFKSEGQLGANFREAVISSVDEYVSTARKMIINHHATPLLNHLKSSDEISNAFPNTIYSAEVMRDMAVNNIPSLTKGFDDSVRNFFDKIATTTAGKVGAKEWFPKLPVFDRAHGLFTNLFYVTALTTRPSFWMGQILTSPTSIRHILREANVFDSLEAAGKGTWNLINPSKDFLKGMYYVTQYTNTMHPQFTNDLTRLELPKFLQNRAKGVENIFEWLVGQKPSQMADSFSRYWTYSMMYEHYKNQGYTGKQLWLKAAEATDVTMVQYGRANKAPIFQRLGIAGEAVSPLQTFAQAQLGNLVSDFKYWKVKDPKTSLPMIATFLTTMLLGGAMGMPLVAEYELIRKMITNKYPEYAEMFPSVIDWALRGDKRIAAFGMEVNPEDYLGESGADLVSDIAGFGVGSAATGYDISSSLRWNPIISGVVTGEKAWYEMFPVAAYGKKLVDFGTTLGGYHAGSTSVSESDRRKAALDITPGAYKALMDLRYNSDERDFVPGGSRGYAKVEQTPQEQVAQVLGTQTLDTKRSSDIVRKEMEKDKIRTQQIQDTMDVFVDSLLSGNDTKGDAALEKLLTLGVSGKQIQRQVKEILRKRNTPEMQRYYADRKGRVSSDEQKRRFEKVAEYE